MDKHVWNLNALKRKMKRKPPGLRLYNFFLGADTILTKQEIADLERVISEENKRLAKYLEAAKQKPYKYSQP